MKKIALSNFVSIDKNLDIISKHRSNLDSLQRSETKREGIES